MESEAQMRRDAKQTYNLSECHYKSIDGQKLESLNKLHRKLGQNLEKVCIKGVGAYL